MMYHKKLLEHFKKPHNYGSIKHPDFSSGRFNPSCGDSIEMTGKIKDGIITDIMFEGSGCIISQAAASMLTEFVKGKAVNEVLALRPQDIIDLIGIELGPNRLQCILLPFEALKTGLSDA